MTSVDYLLIGYISADISPEGRKLGGTVSYAASIASGFNHKVGVVTSAAACEPLLSGLRQYAEISVRIAEETTTFENIYPEPGKRIQYIHELAADIPYEFVPAGWINAPLVHLAPLAGEISPDIVHKFADSTLMLTPQGWLRQWDSDGRVSFKRWFDAEALRAVDLVVFSRQDIAESPDMEQAFASVVKHCLVTNGDRGGTYYYNGEPHPYMAYKVNEVDPTGAGDVFATALLASLPLLENNVHAAVDVAARLAAISVTRPGTASLSVQEIEQALDDAREDLE